jgi:hypothetical protein
MINHPVTRYPRWIKHECIVQSVDNKIVFEAKALGCAALRSLARYLRVQGAIGARRKHTKDLQLLIKGSLISQAFYIQLDCCPFERSVNVSSVGTPSFLLERWLMRLGDRDQPVRGK